MKKLMTVLVVIAVVLIIFLLLGPFYILEEGQQAVVTRFGAIVSTDTQAGLKLKMPVVDTVVRYSKRMLSWDGAAQRIPTRENTFIWVDATARWKITDPKLFYESVTTMEQAYGRLDEVLDSSIRTVISDNLLREAVRNSDVINQIERIDNFQEQEGDAEDMQSLSQLTETQETFENITKGRRILSNDMLTAAKRITPQFGISLEDIIVRQIRYSDDLTQSVYDRMIKQRNQIAQAYRSYGEGKKAEWFGRLDNDRRSILSEAYKTSEEIKGTADATATTIYALAYQVDPEFFSFWSSIESYRKVIPSFRKTLTTDMDYFKYLYDMNGEN